MDAEFPGASADMEEDAEDETAAAPRVLVESAEDQLQDSDSDEALEAPQAEDDARAVEAPGLEADDDFSEADEDQEPFDDEPTDHGDLPAPEVVAREEREVVLQPVQPSLFDAPAPAAPVAPVQPREAAEAKQPPTPRMAETPAASPGAAAASSGPAPTPASDRGPQHSLEAAPAPAKGRRESSGERQVTLTPISAPPARSAVPPSEAPSASAASAPQAGREGEDLVYKSGMLFLKQNRVAVSMLQREFGMDFKQATAVLDELQAQGLIGPYLGGQRRDILLTAEEWRAKVGAPT
ncbi:MAG: hypothetical protein IPK67_02555 [Planctomycetes bacterium]|nr:hypothetical protein [Planctomycetota bacterium]